HRKGFVRRKQAMPSGEQVPFEPAMTKMFAQYLHHTSIWSNMIINPNNLLHGGAVLDLEDSAQAIGIGFIRAEETEILLLCVSREDVAHQLSELTSRLPVLRRRFLHVNRIVRK